MIVINVCLSDIPRDMIVKGKNGKSYCKMVVNKRREKDQYDNDHTVYMSVSKEDSGKPKVYVGSGREIIFKSKNTAPAHQQPVQNDLTDMNINDIDNDTSDLPF